MPRRTAWRWPDAGDAPTGGSSPPCRAARRGLAACLVGDPDHRPQRAGRAALAQGTRLAAQPARPIRLVQIAPPGAGLAAAGARAGGYEVGESGGLLWRTLVRGARCAPAPLCCGTRGVWFALPPALLPCWRGVALPPPRHPSPFLRPQRPPLLRECGNDYSQGGGKASRLRPPRGAGLARWPTLGLPAWSALYSGASACAPPACCVRLRAPGCAARAPPGWLRLRRVLLRFALAIKGQAAAQHPHAPARPCIPRMPARRATAMMPGHPARAWVSARHKCRAQKNTTLNRRPNARTRARAREKACATA